MGCSFVQIFKLFVSVRVKTLSTTNMAASSQVKRQNASLAVAVRRSVFNGKANVGKLYCSHLLCSLIILLLCRQLPSELVIVVNHLSSILGADSRMAEAYVKITSAYGHPAPFRSKLSYGMWVS